MVCDSNKTTLIRKVLSDVTPTTACGKIKELSMIGDCNADISTATMSEESIEDLLEPCPQELWMSRTPSFWDDEMVDDDYDDRRSEEEEAERDFVEIMDILTNTESESSISLQCLIPTESYDNIVVGYSNADIPTIVISSDDSLEDEDDEELCALLYNDQNKQEFGNDAFLIPRPNTDPMTPTVPAKEENASIDLAVPVTPPRPSGPAPFMSRTLSEDGAQEDSTNEKEAAVFNEPPCVERLNRSVHFWDEMNSNNYEEEKEDQENTSSKAMIPSPASSTLTSLPPPLLTTIPPPSVRRIPVKHSYRVTTEIEQVISDEEEESSTGACDEEDRANELLIEDQEDEAKNADDVVIVDFGPLFLVDRLRQSAGTLQKSQESSHSNLEAALNLFRSTSESNSRSATEEEEDNDSDCNTEATVAESMTSTTVDSFSVVSNEENKIVLQEEIRLDVNTNIHLNCQRRVSMLEIREWKEEESWMKNSHVVLQDKSAIKGTTTSLANCYYPNINKHTVLKEAMHIVPPRRRTIHIAMAA